MNSPKFYWETKEIWKEMMADIDSAKVSIEMEQYSFWDDSIGRKFLELLEKKHNNGVKVRILCDGYGSYPLFQSKYARSLISKGMEIRAFNPPSFFRTSGWLYHLHKKTLIIDSKFAWIGGLGIKKKFTYFRDTMARLEGPIVSDIQNSFEVLWSDVRHKNYFRHTNLERQSVDPQLLVNYCRYGRKEIYEQMRQQIQNAEKSIYLTTSYFFPDKNFFQLILDKARSGVDVKIILRGKDDEYLPVRFSTSYFHEALSANIGIYRYETAIIHAKTAIVDGKWATIGSSNLDKFSFYYNMEANIASTNPDFVKHTIELFEANLKNCRKIELSIWKKRALWDRVVELAIWPIHNYL